MRYAIGTLFLAAGLGPVLEGPTLRVQETAPSVASVLQPYVDRGVLAGAVTLVADRHGVKSLEAVGYADIDTRQPMKPDALFWIASQSKPITATALMMLVDERKVNLDDPVAKYLPEFHGQWLAVERDDQHVALRQPSHPITVREILSHTSGLPFASPQEQPTLDGLPLAVAVRGHAMRWLEFEPGTKYQYSNAGINTAGRIIEVVSGKPYETFLDERLFGPLGMKDTTFWPNAEQVKRLAKSYRPDESKTRLEPISITQLRYPLEERAGRYPMPAGGLFSTAADLARFCRMIANGGELGGRRYLSESAVTTMTTKQTPPAVADGYGLGWSVNGKTFGHGGAYSTSMTIDREQGLVLIYQVQHAGFPGDGAQAQGAFQREVETGR